MSKLDALTGWLDANPGMAYAGMGMLKAEMDERRQRALAKGEIARTQYGYLTNAGIGDPEKNRKADHFDRAIQGYITGAKTAQDDKMNNEILRLLKKDSSTPFRKPGSVSEVIPPVVEVPVQDEVLARRRDEAANNAVAQLTDNELFRNVLPEGANKNMNFQDTPYVLADRNEKNAFIPNEYDKKKTNLADQIREAQKLRYAMSYGGPSNLGKAY